MRESTRTINEWRRLRNLDKSWSKSKSNSAKRTLNHTLAEKRAFNTNGRNDTRHINGQETDFSRRSCSAIDHSESSIPEPQLFDNIQPEELPRSPNESNIDSMFNLLLSSNQEHRNQFTKEYMQRKIENKIKEIKELSSERKHKEWINDAKIVLNKNIDDTFSK